MCKNRRKSAAANKAGQPKKSLTNKKKKETPQPVSPEKSIEAAFRRASLGKACPVCGKRLINAVYQRHFDNDEIIYCETIIKTPTSTRAAPADLKPLKGVLKRENSNTSGSTVSVLESYFSTTKKKKWLDERQQKQKEMEDELEEAGPSNAMFLEDQEENTTSSIEAISAAALAANASTYSPPNSKENLPRKSEAETNEFASPKSTVDVNALGLAEVHAQIIHQLEGFLEEHEFRAVPQGNAINAEKLEEKAAGKFNNVHYSLRFIWKIMLKVLRCPEHENSIETSIAFWGDKPLRTLLTFLTCSVKSQQLFARLLLRRWGWHIARDISYPELGTDLLPLFNELRGNALLEAAFYSSKISTDEALKLIHQQDLKPLCKLLKVESGIGRQAIIREFKKYAEQKNVLGMSNRHNLFKCINSQIGECFRIPVEVLNLFNAFYTVYSPNWMDSGQLSEPNQAHKVLASELNFTILQHQIGQLFFMAPSCVAHSLIGCYEDYPALLSYIEAKSAEQQIRYLMDRNSFAEAFELAKDVKAKFAEKFLQGNTPTIRRYMQLPIYLRRFTPPWVLCRCIFHGVEAAQRERNYGEAVEWLKFLVEKKEFTHFCVHSRGHWYQRLALNLEHHLKDREAAAEHCLNGVQDPLLGDKDRLVLQQRLEKLSGRLDWSIQGQQPIVLVEPEKVHIVGRTLGKGLGDGLKVNHFLRPSTSSATSNSNNTSFADKTKCSVEEVAFQHFVQNEGFEEGVHSEGAIWHTLFRLFFWDIIFCHHVEPADVWISSLQDDPFDLKYPSFYENRRHLIDERLKLIRSSPEMIENIALEHFDRVRVNKAANSAIGWHPFEDRDQLIRFLKCCPSQMLHDLLERLCSDFRNNRSGFPDLTVWNAQQGHLAVVEVKGPGDQLSTKQQLWLDFFRTREVRAVVCHVAAKSDRALE